MEGHRRCFVLFFSLQKENVPTFYTTCCVLKQKYHWAQRVWRLGPQALFSLIQPRGHHFELWSLGAGGWRYGPRGPEQVSWGAVKYYGLGLSFLKEISQPILAPPGPLLFSFPTMGRCGGNSAGPQRPVHPKEDERAARGTSLMSDPLSVGLFSTHPRSQFVTPRCRPTMSYVRAEPRSLISAFRPPRKTPKDLDPSYAPPPGEPSPRLHRSARPLDPISR